MQKKAIVFITGVAGCGKTTIGKMLSKKIGMPFYDGDDFHSHENIQKMKSGVSLTDEDRSHWLKSINTFVQKKLKLSGGIVACSALKEKYRTILALELVNPIKWVFLEGDQNLIADRIRARKGHFFSEELLQSQFDILEKSQEALVLDVSKSKEQITEEIVKELAL